MLIFNFNFCINSIIARPKKPPLRDEADMSVLSPILQTTSSPTFVPDEITSPPEGLCALSVNPQLDTDLNKDSGFRFGMLIEKSI